MCVSISASVALGCLFTPKVYIVIFQPYKNVRQGSGQVKVKNHVSNDLKLLNNLKCVNLSFFQSSYINLVIIFYLGIKSQQKLRD